MTDNHTTWTLGNLLSEYARLHVLADHKEAHGDEEGAYQILRAADVIRQEIERRCES